MPGNDTEDVCAEPCMSANLGKEPFNAAWDDTIRKEERFQAQQMLPLYGINGEKLMAEVARLRLLRKPPEDTKKPDRKVPTRESFGVTWAPKTPGVMQASLRVSPMSFASYAHKKIGGMCDEQGFRYNSYVTEGGSGRLLTGNSVEARRTAPPQFTPRMARHQSSVAPPRWSVTRAGSEVGSMARSEIGSRAQSEADLRSLRSAGASSVTGSRACSRRSRGSRALSAVSSVLVKQAVQLEVDRVLEELG